MKISGDDLKSERGDGAFLAVYVQDRRTLFFFFSLLFLQVSRRSAQPHLTFSPRTGVHGDR